MPPINDQIQADKVRLIDEEGTMIGVKLLSEALDYARTRKLDLVAVSPNVIPPVCKVLDFGKLKFKNRKKNSDSKKKQKQIKIKEVKLRPHIEEHDYQVKFKSTKKFLEQGNKVKVSLRFRGREIVHKDIAEDLMKRLIEDLGDVAKVEFGPKLDGRQMMLVLASGVTT